MDMNRELDGLLERMVTEYVARNRAAKILRALLEEAGVGFYPVVDHVTLRTMDIDRRAEPFITLGYTYDETLQYDDWYAKVYRKTGYPPSSWIRPMRTPAGKPASSRDGWPPSATRSFTMWRCASRISTGRSLG